ncbi:O-antigen ligase family protein [Catenovulum sp. SX2]|uniref:O-antigen ligase family protein n=1 Tax=Catenovulum sp. SX2 TaxID=3398614 RepID=UPI003F82F734
MIAAVQQRINFSIYWRKQNFALLFMWIMMHLSHKFSPFPEYFAGVRADIVLSAMNTIVIMYFVGLGILSHVADYKKIFFSMAIMFGGISVYYVYWANDLYFSYRWDMFTNGRLNSPRGTSIGDQNALSCLIVMGMPFILLGYFYLKNKWHKWACLAVLPVLWHALFLFGSRGAMLAVVATTIFVLKTLDNKKAQKLALQQAEHPEIELSEKKKENLQRFKNAKMFKVFIGVGLAVALVIQGGAMIQRSTETAARAQAGGDEPLNPRLVSWAVGQKLIKEFPLLGAGPQRFQMASDSLYPGENVHVAHNTFLNFAANTGLPVGIMYLLMFWFNFKNYRYCSKNGIHKYPVLEYTNKACGSALLAYFICALFLDLIIFEAFYFILMLNLAKLYVFEKLVLADKEQKNEQQKAGAQQFNRQSGTWTR